MREIEREMLREKRWRVKEVKQRVSKSRELIGVAVRKAYHCLDMIIRQR